MGSKKRKRKMEFPPQLEQLGGAVKQVFVAAASHPVCAALAVMGTTVTVKMLVTQGREDSEWRRRFNGEMSGLYDGAQKLGAAAAVTPAIAGALNLLQQAVATRAPAQPTKTT